MFFAAHACRRLLLLGSGSLLVAVTSSCSSGGGPQLASAAMPLAGQGGGLQMALPRPALAPDADTCDAYAYYLFGRSQLREHPTVAAAAFYWTQRLSPSSPFAYYSERVALLMADPRLLRGYVDGDRRTLQSAKVRWIDSLQVQAITLDPFFPQPLDEDLIVKYLTNRIGNQIRSQLWQTSAVSDQEIEDYIRSEIDNADPATRAWLAFGRGQYREAADYWAGELLRHPGDADLRVRRSQALFLLGQLDSASAELEAALVMARRSDAEKMRYVYDSKVLWVYELGRIHEQEGNWAAARDAYQRALVEDLSFYPAHVRLAYVAVRAGDTATAVTELERAITIKDDDFSAQLLLGKVNAARRAFGPATQQLHRAAEIEPWVAYPHFALGNVRMEAVDREGAAIEYQRFLALAARTDPNVAAARRRLAALAPPAP